MTQRPPRPNRRTFPEFGRVVKATCRNPNDLPIDALTLVRGVRADVTPEFVIGLAEPLGETGVLVTLWKDANWATKSPPGRLFPDGKVP